MTAFVGIWVILVSIVGLNLAAGGVAAILHARRGKQRRRSRILTAAAITALLPTSMMVPAMLMESSIGTEASIGLTVAIGMMFVMGFAGSLPGALIVARKLEAPGDDYRAFE